MCTEKGYLRTDRQQQIINVCVKYHSVADPGFPGGRGPPTWVLSGENLCEDERIGSYGGGRVPKIFACRSATAIDSLSYCIGVM